MALIAGHLNAGVSLVMTVQRSSSSSSHHFNSLPIPHPPRISVPAITY